MPDSHNNFESNRLSSYIPIFQKAYELYKIFYGYIVHFPKKDRFTLGRKIENAMLDIMEFIVVAIQLSKSEKLSVLQKTSIKLDFLKILIRLAKDLKILDYKKYLTLESHIQEIGKMLGGWIKSSSVSK